MSMSHEELVEFGRTLVQSVRDTAIQNSDMALRADVDDPVARRWRARGVEGAEVVIPDVVDEVVFRLLNAIDQGLLRLVFVTSSGRHVDLAEEGLGELGGWYMGSDGWRNSYSNQRFVDDCGDLGESDG